MSVSPGKLVYVAAQVGVDSDGNLVGKGDAAAQTRQALQNIGPVLAGAGADFSNVVEFTTYGVVRSSVQGYLDGCGELYPHMYPDRDFPPTPCSWLRAWYAKHYLVEIKAVAALP